MSSLSCICFVGYVLSISDFCSHNSRKQVLMENNEMILYKLNRIEKYIFGLKDILNVEELADYTGFKKSYIYKLVHENLIPFSKPNGKILFFERKKIDEWLLQNAQKSKEEIQNAAIDFVYGSRT